MPILEYKKYSSFLILSFTYECFGSDDFIPPLLFILFNVFFRWRTMFGIAIVPSILLALGMAFSPESPRWLFQVFLQDSGVNG